MLDAYENSLSNFINHSIPDVIWTDSEIPGIYSVALQNKSCEITSGPDCQRVMTLTVLEDDPGFGDLVVVDGILYFTDKSKQAIQRCVHLI